MNGALRKSLALAALCAAGVGGYWAGGRGMTSSGLGQPGVQDTAKAATGPVIYYRDPDAPAYSSTQARSASGKDYVAVRASEDLSFDDKPAQAPASLVASEPRRIRFYRNPMGLPDTSAKPKKDSMGMDYLPVYEGEENDDGSVRISPSRIQKTGVRSEPVERRALDISLRAPGTIQLDERRISVVSLRFEGFIDTVENVTTGSQVRKGQPLMKIYGPGLSNASAEYLSALGARSDGSLSSQAMKGARRRLDNLGMPETATAELERSREVPVTITWPAPRDGIILERSATNGMRAAAGDVLFRIADVSVIWALVDLSERDIALVAVGQMVTVSPRGMPGQKFAGKIALVYPQINKETRTGRIRVELDNTAGKLMPDMYVDADIAIGDSTEVLTVSGSAVIDSGARQVVLIDKGEGRFEPRPVELGRRGGDRVEIRKGVMAGDKVVVSANFLIDAESNLKAALQGLDTAEKAQ